MQNTISITVSADHRVCCPEWDIARTGENECTRFDITLAEELSTYSAYIDFEKPDGEKFKTPRLIIENNKITYDLPSTVLDVKGNLLVQLVLQNDEGEIWKSNVQKFYVSESVDATEAIAEKDDFVADIEKRVDGKLDKSTKKLTVYNVDENGEQRVLPQRSDVAKGYTFPLRFKDGQVVVARSDIKTSSDDLTYPDWFDGGKTKVLDYKTCAVNQYQLEEAVNPYKTCITPDNGNRAVKIGMDNTVLEKGPQGYSALIGQNNTLTGGRCSLVGGYGSNGKFNDSIMWGNGLIDDSGAYGKAVFGNYNSPSKARFVIGDGQNKDDRKNAVEIYDGGQVFTPHAPAYQSSHKKRLTTKEYVDNLVQAPAAKGVFTSSITIGDPDANTTGGINTVITGTSIDMWCRAGGEELTITLGNDPAVYYRNNGQSKSGSAKFEDIVNVANAYANSSQPLSPFVIGILKTDTIEVQDALILKSPNGTKYKLTVADDGTLSTAKVD